MDIKTLKQINWKQPKYMIPLIIYFPLLFVGYFMIDLFHTDKADVGNKNLETTEYLNPNLPGAQMKGDGIGTKYESMLKSYGKIDDYSAMANIDRNNEQQTEGYDSRYTDEDLEQLATQQGDSSLQRRLMESAQRGMAMSDGQMNRYNDSEAERLLLSQQREREAMEDLNRALAQARLQGQQVTERGTREPTPTYSQSSDRSTEYDDFSFDDEPNRTASTDKTQGSVDVNDKSVRKPAENAEAQEVVKKVKVSSDYFNTLCENEKEPNLIKAIIDEDVKAVDGSRVRLRLLDDIEINETVVPKGSYIYAIMNGFGSQRVKGSVKSILVQDDLIKVNLSLYDTDGLEGLYVPNSSFRETTKEVAAGAMSNTNSLTSGSSSANNALSQWGTQALTNAVSKTTNAISKAIKKNSAKLKYGTFVYLINERDKNN